MKPFLSTLVVFAVTWLASCTASSSGNNSNAAVSPSPTKEQTERREIKAVQTKVISDFVEKNHKGWRIEGIGPRNDRPDELDEFLNEEKTIQCKENDPCDLHLSNGKEEKIIQIILKRFYKTDGSSYWLVREARSIDLALDQIRQIRETQREVTLRNLSADDCQAVIEELREASYDPGDYDQSN